MIQEKIIGVVHLLPLPGTPHGIYSLSTVLDRALQDARALKEGGVSCVMIENFGDAPFVRHKVEPHIVSMMTLIAKEIQQLGLTIGINVLRNDACAAMAIATAVDAKLIRVNVHTGAAWTDQGLIQGDAYKTLMYRKQLSSEVSIMADVMVKHATPAGTRTLLDAAKDTVHRGGADALIVTGTATGATADLNDLLTLRAALPNVKLWVGSGVVPENVQDVLSIADGAIVGTHFHADADLSKPLDAGRIRNFMDLL